MRRLLGLDVGDRTIGVAVSDPLGVTAQGVTVIRRGGGDDLDKLVPLLEEYEPEAFVVGLPRSLDGSLGPQAEKVEAFCRLLEERFRLPVHRWDERLTTREAERVLIEADLSRRRRKGVIDMTAAVLILQSFLDSRGIS